MSLKTVGLFLPEQITVVNTEEVTCMAAPRGRNGVIFSHVYGWLLITSVEFDMQSPVVVDTKQRLSTTRREKTMDDQSPYTPYGSRYETITYKRLPFLLFFLYATAPHDLFSQASTTTCKFIVYRSSVRTVKSNRFNKI